MHIYTGKVLQDDKIWAINSKVMRVQIFWNLMRGCTKFRLHRIALTAYVNRAVDTYSVTSLPATVDVTKRTLISDMAKIFDVLGWFFASIIKAKIQLQRLWESKIGWDDMLPLVIHQTWQQWTSELHLLAGKHIPRYYTKNSDVYTQSSHREHRTVFLLCILMVRVAQESSTHLSFVM